MEKVWNRQLQRQFLATSSAHTCCNDASITARGTCSQEVAVTDPQPFLQEAESEVHAAESEEVMEDAVSGEVEEFDDAHEVRTQFQIPQSPSPVTGR